MMKFKSGLFAVVILIAILALVPATSASVNNYSWWNDHHVSYTTAYSVPGALAEGIVNIYNYTTIIQSALTANAMCIEKGYPTGATPTYGQQFLYRHADDTGQGSYFGFATGSANQSTAYLRIINGKPYKSDTNASMGSFTDGDAHRWGLYCGASATQVDYGVQYVYHDTIDPNIYYTNVTVNVKSSSTGLNLPNVNVEFHNTATSYIGGVTNATGNVTFDLIGIYTYYYPNITASITGYTTKTVQLTDNPNQYSIYKAITLDPAPVYNINSYLDVRDASTGIYIGNVSVGIRNLTDMSWRNSTSNTGAVIFNSTGASYQYPLSTGQTVGYSASSLGYSPAYTNDTLMFNNWLTTLFLTRTDQQPSNGTWSLVVTIKRNADAAPISGATVTVTSGVSGVGTWQQTTDVNGIASFVNITPSTLALVEAVKQGYQSNSLVVTVFPNTTQHVHLELVAIGQTPVETPVPTSTVTGAGTTSPYPVLTDANGIPITSPEGKGLAAFGLLADAAYVVMSVAVGTVMIWLLWQVVYQITGGKVIERMMRRGRH